MDRVEGVVKPVFLRGSSKGSPVKGRGAWVLVRFIRLPMNRESTKYMAAIQAQVIKAPTVVQLTPIANYRCLESPKVQRPLDTYW